MTVNEELEYWDEIAIDFCKKIVIKLISTCLQNKVSPILVNMGIWYFCSRCIGNSERLIELIQKNDIKVLENELLLMNGFDNYKISFIN